MRLAFNFLLLLILNSVVLVFKYSVGLTYWQTVWIYISSHLVSAWIAISVMFLSATVRKKDKTCKRVHWIPFDTNLSNAASMESETEATSMIISTTITYC